MKSVSFRFASCAAVLLAALPAGLAAQEAAPAQNAMAASPQLSFMLDFPGHDISHFVIQLHADGSGSFDTTGSAAAPEGVMPVEFRLPVKTVNQWFDLVRQAKYFSVSPGEMKRVAYAGTKTLTWNDGTHPVSSIQFSVSTVKPLQELGQQFQALAATLQLGLSLAADARFHPMQSDHDMDALASSLKDGVATHPEVIAAQLRALAADTAVIGKVRRQAEAILSKLPQQQ